MVPIIFTSIYDDEYGGDLNGDATSTVPAPGDWYGVWISGNSNDSVFDYTVFRYGGAGNYEKANLYVENTSVNISNSVFEYSKVYGLSLTNSDSQVSGNVFRYNNTAGELSASGLRIFNSSSTSSPTIQNNTFQENRTGIALQGGTPNISQNTFTSNLSYPIKAQSSFGTFSENSGSGNGIDAILLQSAITKTNGTTTLRANFLPYMFSGELRIMASSTLVVEPEVVVKSSGGILRVYGNLNLNGQNPEDIVFTSINDDSVGGDTNNDGICRPDNASSTAQCPSPGDWSGISLLPEAEMRAMGFAVKYAGGTGARGASEAGLTIQESKVNLENALFDTNTKYGVKIINATTTIKNSEFRNHTQPGNAAALAYYNSPINLENVTFSGNNLAIYADSKSIVHTATDLMFLNNAATTSPEDLLNP